MRSLLALMFLGLLVVAGPAAAVTLKIATLSPDGTSWMKNMRAAGKEIAERTGGRVKLRFYPGGVMGNYRSMLRKIRIGQLHGAAVTSGDLVDVVPDAYIYGLPFLFRDLGEVDYVRKRIDPVIMERLKKNGLICFGFAEGGFSHIMSKQRIQTLDDAKHRKFWAPTGDRVTEAALSALGISPISLQLIDVLTGLQTGLVDTVTSPPAAAIALQWHTQVRYLLDMPLTYIYGTLVISDKALRRLSAEDRATLRTILTDTFERMDSANRKENAAAKAALRNQGIQFLVPAADDRAAWERSIEQAILKLGEDGFFTEGMVQQVRDPIREYRKRTPQPGP
jgi:TRAP-type C4-dicarboxylate transport system substrate-binding protein